MCVCVVEFLKLWICTDTVFAFIIITIMLIDYCSHVFIMKVFHLIDSLVTTTRLFEELEQMELRHVKTAQNFAIL